MKVLAFNSTGKNSGNTSKLTRKALEGAASQGADTEMVLLKDYDIGFCNDCYTCYQNHDSDIGPCSIDDDVTGLLEKVKGADGVIFASPLHSGFINGRMTAFMERAVFRLCTPTGEMMGLKGCPMPRLTDKARAAACIINAGMIPPEARQYCDLATPWLKEGMGMMVNGPVIQDMYAAAIFDQPLSDEDASRGFLLRKLKDEQLEEAYQLGVNLAQAIKDGLTPYDPNAFISLMAQE